MNLELRSIFYCFICVWLKNIVVYVKKKNPYFLFIQRIILKISIIYLTVIKMEKIGEWVLLMKRRMVGEWLLVKTESSKWQS